MFKKAREQFGQGRQFGRRHVTTIGSSVAEEMVSDPRTWVEDRLGEEDGSILSGSEAQEMMGLVKRVIKKSASSPFTFAGFMCGQLQGVTDVLKASPEELERMRNWWKS